MSKNLTQLEEEVSALTQRVNSLISKIEAKEEYEQEAKEEAEKRFNRNITIAGIAVTLFGVILPILIQLLILVLSREKN